MPLIYWDGKETTVVSLPWNPHASFAGVALKHLITGAQTGGRLNCHLVRIDPGCIAGDHCHFQPVNIEARDAPPSVIGEDSSRQIVDHHGALEEGHRWGRAIFIANEKPPRFGVKALGRGARLPQINASRCGAVL